jgi:hypothetical protein
VTKAEAYDTDRHAMEVALQFTHSAPQAAFALLQPVSPNPSNGPVTAEFFLPESANITLSLSDLNGGAVSTQSDYYEAGWHKVQMNVGSSQVSGIYCLRLASPFGNQTQRVMLQR